MPFHADNQTRTAPSRRYILNLACKAGITRMNDMHVLDHRVTVQGCAASMACVCTGSHVCPVRSCSSMWELQYRDLKKISCHSA